MLALCVRCFICDVGNLMANIIKAAPKRKAKKKQTKKKLAEHMQSPRATEGIVLGEVTNFLLVYTDLSLPLGNKYVNVFAALCVIKYPSSQRNK